MLPSIQGGFDPAIYNDSLIQQAIQSGGTLDGGDSANIQTNGAETSLTVGNNHSAVSISWSLDAQNALSKDEEALALIDPKAKVTDAQQSNTKTADKNNQSDTGSASGQQAGQAGLAFVGMSIEQIIKNGQTSLAADPTAAFYNGVMESGGPAQFISYNSDPALQASFVKAFNSGSLTIQDVTQVPQLNYTSNVFITGTGESVTAGWDTNVEQQMDAANGTYSTGMVFPSFGAVYVTWANPSAKSASTGVSMTA